MVEKILVSISLCVFMIGTYLIWFSRKNIFNHINLGLCFVAYFVPLFVIDYDLYFEKSVWDLYAAINIIGVFFFLAGMFLGYKWKAIRVLDSAIKFNFLKTVADDSNIVDRVIKLSNIVFIIGIVGIIVSFAAMGFIPMFAADPYSAKFFKGAYQVPYQRVAFLYRTARQFVEFFIPLKALEIYVKPTKKNIVLLLLAIFLIAVSLTRGAIANGVLVAIAIVVSLKRANWPFWAYISFVFVTYGIGSGILYVIAYLFPSDKNIMIDNINFFQAIAFGAPDIVDQLGFLTAYIRSGSHLTYGLTFIGGLIPFNFPWNSSVYTLSILNDNADVSEISSGGLRLSIPLWGYISFGWLGVAIIPFITAFFTGYMTKKVKLIVDSLKADRNGYISFFLAFFMFNNIAIIFYAFTLLTIYWLPGLIIYYLLVRYCRKSEPLNQI